MQIVIKIPDSKYQSILSDYYCGLLDADLYKAIKDGTPLPNRAADTLEDLSEKLRTSRYSEAGIQNMQELEQAEIQKAYELGRMEHETCEDCINRHKAIIQLSHNKTGNDDADVVVQKDIETIKALPPVTPGSTFCDVAISKQAAINAVNIGNLNPGIVEALQSILAELPPVTPQPKMGKWIKSRDSYGNNHFTCPFCEHDIATKYVGIWEDNYCSNCGAKMEEVKE